MTDHDADRRFDVDQIIRKEQLLLDPLVRKSSDVASSLLHQDYVEVGASGKSWDRSGAIAAMGEEVVGHGPVADATDISAMRLADDVMLVTYQSQRSGRVTMRSSIWVRVGVEWKLRFHQGTVVDP